MSTRRAISLAELLVVMTICSVVLTMSASLLHRAMHVETKSRAFYDGERSALRLARQFRHDVHRATKASIGDGEPGENVVLRLEFDDESTAEYRHSGREMVRTLSRAGGTAWREEFAFRTPFDLDIRQEDSPPRVILTVTGKRDAPASARSTPTEVHIEAGLGAVSRQEALP